MRRGGGILMKRLGLVGVAGLIIFVWARPAAVVGQYGVRTGDWPTRIPTGGPQSGLPTTYLLNGRQYIVFAASSAAGGSAQLVAYALPSAAATGARGGARGGGQRGAQQ